MKGKHMTNRKTCIVFIFVVLCCMIATSITWAENNGAKYTPGELLIKFKAGVSNEKAKEICARHGAYVDGEVTQIGVKLIKVPEHALETVMSALGNNPNIEFVEPNFIVKAATLPNDPSYSSQWHLLKISAPAGWDINTGLTEVVIAVIDSGVDSDHPDLVDKLVSGYNFLDGY
ncbi:MAG: peptidase S8, partial [Nanoarchaeota archaeon]|nr:peptidase S8 [Nanoarchaeota archaeon]